MPRFHPLARAAVALAALPFGTLVATSGASGATHPSSSPLAPTPLSNNLAIAVGPSATLAGATTGCQLANGVQHVFYIGFDNFHLRRDNANTVANNGDLNNNSNLNIPSDLEQVPALYNFLRGTGNSGLTPNPSTANNANYADGRSVHYTDGTAFLGGTVLANQHTPLISHTSVDFTTTYSGLYGDRNGVAVSQNSIAAYTGNAATPVASTSGFSYWTDPLGIGNDPTNVITTKDAGGNPVNAPAPWVPFTRAGCDVGAVASTGSVLENAKSVSSAFGTTSTEATQAGSTTASVRNQATADYIGLAIHCTTGSAVCAKGTTDPNVKPVADVLPSEPGGYTGYQALFGNKYIAPAINDAINGTPSGGSTAVPLLRSGSSTDGFPGFNGQDGNYTLGYALAMQKAGVPVTFGYLSDAHDCHSFPYTASSGSGIKDSRSTINLDYGGTYNPTTGVGGANPCAYSTVSGTNTPTFGAFGSGEQGYTNYLNNLNTDFQTFFDQAKAAGYTTGNTEFVFYSDENDHTAEATPVSAAAPTPCDGVNVACQYNHAADVAASTPGQLGEVNVPLNGLLPSRSQQVNQPYFQLNDSAPDFYLSNKGSATPPAQNSPNVRNFEQDLASATYTDPYTGTPTKVVNYEGDQTELNALHMITADPLRSPTVTAFAPGADYVATSGCAAGETACSNAGFAYIHGDFAQETNTTWAGVAGPGVANLGSTSTWTDHVDLRPTLLALVGLHDDYTNDGRVVTEILTPGVLPATGTTTTATDLGTLLKKLDAPVYSSTANANDGFGPATLVADTSALTSNAPSDGTYTDVTGRIAQATAERNAVAGDIKARLLAADSGSPIDPTAAATDQSNGTCLLAYANALKAYAASPSTATAPVDCGIATGPVAALAEVGRTPLLLIGGGAVVAAGLLFAGRRRRQVPLA